MSARTTFYNWCESAEEIVYEMQSENQTEPSSCKVEDREIYKHEYNIQYIT